ncbi:MAG: PD40 domain-containing protein [Calditrichae bacterium]|nr:PD40 domain-containing protein [Calditrichia bacterium]
MKNLCFASFLLFCQLVFAEPVYFATDPALSPDGEQVVFSYEGDLWQVPAAGGTAFRLTGMEGREQAAAFSPDGKWIAFTAEQDGNNNVYVMPAGGGEVRQLTFHDGSDMVNSWSWDGQYVYFTSNRYNQFSAYKVALKGGTPQRLLEHYFNTILDVVEDPGGNGFYFTDSWESQVFPQRKGYQGDNNPDIKHYNPRSGELRQLTDYRGKDFRPSVDRAGKLYFISDEANGEYNLYTFENGQKTPLTRFDLAIKNPRVAANGEKVVFEKGYQLFVYDVALQESRQIPIRLALNNTLALSQDFPVAGNISGFDLSPDGKKFAFIARGELFVCDTKGKFVRQMPTDPQGRVTEVKWLQDNRRLIYNQTDPAGWLNWFVIEATGRGAEKQLTSDAQNNRNLSLNRERTRGVYLSGREEVRLLDLANFTSETITRDELWGFYNSTPYFSPDDRYLVYTAYRNFEQDIFIYDLKTKQTRNLTATGVTESDPFWSPDGRYLYFSSDRYHPNYPYGTENARIYRLPLTRFDQDFRSDRFDSLFVEKKDDKEKDKGKRIKDEGDKEKDKGNDQETEKGPVVKIDFERVLDRFEQVSPDFGQQFNALVLQKDDETTVLYTSNHEGGKYNIWKTVYQPFEAPKTEKIKGAESYSLHLVSGDDKHFILLSGNIHELKLGGNEVEQVKIEHRFQRNLRAEFNQMFHETWANLEENFYDEHFHGANWVALGKRYAAFLPHVASREDLRVLLNDMLGELNASHLAFRSSGKEEETFYSLRSRQTGLIFDDADPYRVARIVADTPADKAGKDVRPGDVLVGVDGTPVDPARNRESYFLSASRDEEMTLTFRRGGKPHDVKLHPQSSGSIRQALYDEWIAANQQRVDARSGKRIAYIHMKNMGGGSLEQFLREISSEAIHRDALILDLRYNTGGNVHDRVLQTLSQRPYMQWKYREGTFAPQPNWTPAAKPMILLINAVSLSDAEVTANGFKTLKLGKVIGTETYRWIIFTTGKGLVDGSYYRLPAWGCYTLDGKDLEREGVAPDIYIKNTVKDRLEGKDPQLERAIAEILEMLE